MSLERAIQETASKHVSEIAENLGKSESLIYRYANPHDDVNFSILHVIPLIRITGNLAILKAIAKAVGCAVIKLPKHLPKIGVKTVVQLQGEMIRVSRTLLDLNEGAVSREEARGEIYRLVEKLLYVDRIIEKGNELPNEEGQKCLLLLED